MQRPKICLCLTGSTLSENLSLLNKYRAWIDIAELRVDYLTKDERLHIRKFPALADFPCILTIRRTIDGGLFCEGEAARTTLMARGLAFAEQDTSKNFAYIDLEEDYDVPSLQDAAFAFGTRVIRSYHNMSSHVWDIARRMEKMRPTGYEIPKIACMPRSMYDVTDLFRQAQEVKDFEHILIAMGPLGLPTRILANKMNSFLTYTSPIETIQNTAALGQIDPMTLNETYNFRAIDDSTRVYGITGYPLETTSSPRLHNTQYRRHGMNAVYVPIRAEKIEEALDFADQVGIQGLSVTVPHKETVMADLQQLSEEAGEIGACNTIIKRGSEWIGYNTDAYGFTRALCEFLDVKTLAHRKVAIIGAGGAAKAVAHSVKMLRGKACVFNRSPARAKSLAESYNFKWAPLGPESLDLLESYSDIIIQTTSIGMNAQGMTFHHPEHDPLHFYTFRGTESVYDVIYHPEKTPVLLRAEGSGCKVCNGYTMLKYQAYRQFELFTGVNPEKE